MRISLFIAALFVIPSVISCNNERREVVNNQPGVNDLAEVNRYLIEKDRERIQSYVGRKELKMNESPSGLWYYLRKEGSGRFFRDNDRIEMKYRCSLLDGTPCYSSDESGLKIFVLGRTEIETGLNEGLRMMKNGGEAIFILPPFLAYGIVGDGKSIPPRAILVYEIEAFLADN
jgi:FKBP-type peptidyl-prolyl cis-trans isomerase